MSIDRSSKFQIIGVIEVFTQTGIEIPYVELYSILFWGTERFYMSQKFKKNEKHHILRHTTIFWGRVSLVVV